MDETDGLLQPNPMADGIEVQFDATVATVADRIAQEVARRYLEPRLEPAFHADSYDFPIISFDFLGFQFRARKTSIADLPGL